MSKKQKKSIKKEHPPVDFIIENNLNESIDTSVHRDSYLEQTFKETMTEEGDLDQISFSNS